MVAVGATGFEKGTGDVVEGVTVGAVVENRRRRLETAAGVVHLGPALQEPRTTGGRAARLRVHHVWRRLCQRPLAE